MAYKVFTNGSTLQASEINDNLMQQAVAVFSNAAARTAGITSPVEGQLTYLEDVNRYDHWDGSSWISPFGLTHIATGTVTSSTGIIFNNVFSSSYNNYRIVITGTGSVSSQRLAFRLRSSSTDFSGTHLTGTSGFNIADSSTTVFRTNSVNSFDLGFIGSTSPVPNVYTFDLTNPFLTTTKTMSGTSVGQQGGVVNLAGTIGGFNDDTTSRDGVNIFSASNWTGTARIYGYRNA